ncbi:helix-turn-helix domain-containing protein [Thermomonas fusca]
MSLGERIKQARKATGLNQTDFGKACGVSLNAQSNFERGDNVPGGAYLMAAAKLGVDVNLLLVGFGGARDAVESELLLRYRAASQEVKGAVLRILDVPASASSPPAVAVTGGEHGQVVVGPVKQRDVTFNVGGKKRGTPR